MKISSLSNLKNDLKLDSIKNTRLRMNENNKEQVNRETELDKR